jgi:trehalose 6-phosphate synthase/phosphatase
MDSKCICCIVWNVLHEKQLCQHSENHGVLVLSEFSGSALSFSSAQHVNPWNTDELVSVMESALCMSRHERKLRHDVAYDFVSTHTVKLWSNNFLQGNNISLI